MAAVLAAAAAVLPIPQAAADPMAAADASSNLALFAYALTFIPAIKVLLGGDAGAIEEYFRAFVSYGVIALALALHAWKKKPAK